MKIVSLNCGKPKLCLYKGREFETSIFKSPVKSPLQLNKNGVDGDHISDLKNHGGIDKAVYAFSAEHFSYWQTELNQSFDYGAFGENLTLDMLDENTLYVGDQYSVGTSIIEVSEPRIPCFKLDIRFNNQNIIELFNDHNHCGSYFRVIKEGSVSIGDELVLIKRDQILVSIKELFEFIKNKGVMEKSRAKAIQFQESLSAKYKKKIETIANQN